jgi:hypothetical protein
MTVGNVCGSPILYAVGFVASDQPRANSLGSGTLVSFGTLRGVLTAAHVIDALKQSPEIGFVNFAQRLLRSLLVRGCAYCVRDLSGSRADAGG